MIDTLNKFLVKFEEINNALSTINVSQNMEKYLELTKELSYLAPIVNKTKEYLRVIDDIKEYEAAIYESDEDLKELAHEELPAIKEQKIKLENEIKFMLIPKNPNDEKDIIVEVRAGTGGDEAAIFAADLYRMYIRYAEKKNWTISVMSSNEIGVGGYKEIIFQIKGTKVYSRLKYESGTHRVQRVPKTEASGRIHTSAATVAVLPEAEEVDVNINPGDLRIDVFRSSGCGGQHVNTTESAVRITHIPTNTVVTCQDEKSQHKNKAKALTVLRARIYEKMQNELDKDRASQRKIMVGSGDRSERIRTYNFPQGRVSDHRIGLTIYKLENFMDGDLDEIIDGLINHEQNEAITSNEA